MKSKTRNSIGWFEDCEVAAIRRLCQIAAKLNVRVISTRRWPESLTHVRCAGMYIPSGVVKRGHRRDVNVILRFFHVKPPVILLRGSCLPYVLSHELGHAASEFSDYIDARTSLMVSPLLDRVAARHGFTEYCRSTRRELRADCIGRRLLGKTLPPSLRRFSERAWSDLHWRMAQ